MGTTNDIKETNISLQLEGKICPQCSQAFTQTEIDNNNYDIWFDTTNDVKLIPMEEIEETSLYFPFGKTGYQLTIWIRHIDHASCPEVKKCEKCYERFLEEKMKEIDDERWGMIFYCQPCYQQIKKE